MATVNSTKPTRQAVDNSQTTKYIGAFTTAYDFCPVGKDGETLFSVRAGVPLQHAFNELSSLVSASMENIRQLTDESQDPSGVPGALYQSIHLLNFSFALIQSINGGHISHVMGQA